MKRHVKLFEEFINETQYQTFGASDDDERNAAQSSGASMPWKNSKALVTTIKKYITPSMIKTLSTSRVTLKPGSSQYVTFKANDGFNLSQVAKEIKPALASMFKWDKLHAVLIPGKEMNDDKPTSFSLNIMRQNNDLTDDAGKKLDLTKIPSEFYFT